MSLIGLLCIVLVLSALTFYVVDTSQKTLVALEVNALTNQTKMVSDMIDVYGQGLRRPTLNLLSMFRATLPQGYMTGNNKIRVGETDLPVLIARDEQLNNNTFHVDRFHTLTSAVGMIFVKSGDDFFRISTSLTDDKNQRAVSTTARENAKTAEQVSKLANQAVAAATENADAMARLDEVMSAIAAWILGHSNASFESRADAFYQANA